ncbi:hypothetical protein CV_3997 [Chromobacterium violaceum ATCC 12472]|uniref:Uncharacterized protein n=1 Tax=Chromobacterium violaceum (strain ATCC 12472 / DSM 30191 / JCM 1249 / CCUG 213 / NBRC 12614 / NCIMB 9131 / NCTC 9757 / MK) TaxID=243365 RepID=Q7NQY8_CHRVO|nr:hypothetical protein CV_3997 [Chromobacterium violaceum ATCC 12472]
MHSDPPVNPRIAFFSTNLGLAADPACRIAVFLHSQTFPDLAIVLAEIFFVTICNPFHAQVMLMTLS